MDIVLRMLFDSIPRECSTNAYSRSSDLSLRMFGLPSLMASDLKDNEHRTCESQQRVCVGISPTSLKLNASAKVENISHIYKFMPYFSEKSINPIQNSPRTLQGESYIFRS